MKFSPTNLNLGPLPGLPRTNNRAFIGAYKKGYYAARTDKPRVTPYGDWRTYHGGVTFSRAFIRYWLRGYDDAKKMEVEPLSD